MVESASALDYPRISPATAIREHLGEALRSSVLLQLMLAMCFVALAAMLYLAQASQASVLQFNIDDLQANRAQLQSQNATLHATATGLQSLQRIDAAATGSLHMTKPDFTNTIWIQTTIPSVAPVPDPNTDVVSVQRQSQPVGWLRRFFRFVKNSL